MTLTKQDIFVLAFIVVFGLVAGIALSMAPVSHADNAYTSTQFQTASTSITVSVNTSTRILATSSPALFGQRAFADICNAGAATVAIRMDGDKAENANTTGGILIAAGTCFEINDLKLYTGSIQASSTNGVAQPVLVQEYEQ